jgi:hypothetical protein
MRSLVRYRYLAGIISSIFRREGASERREGPRSGGSAPGEVKAHDGGRGEEEELSVRVSPLLVMFFVLCMCTMLVLLYFFFDQLGK